MAIPATRMVAGAVFAGVATVAAEVLYAARRDLPDYPDLDPSGVFGHPDAPALRIAALGDSSITGPGLTHPDELWLRQVVRGPLASHRVELTSVGRGGARTNHVLEEQLDRLGDGYDVAVLSVGGNDVLRGKPMDRIEEELDAAVAELMNRADAVVLCGIGDVGSAPRIPFPAAVMASRLARRGDKAHQRVASRYARAHKVELWEETTDEFRSRDDIWSADLFHPNAEGHAIWARVIGPVVAAAAGL